jgi:hypothetical protein
MLLRQNVLNLGTVFLTICIFFYRGLPKKIPHFTLQVDMGGGSWTEDTTMQLTCFVGDEGNTRKEEDFVEDIKFIILIPKDPAKSGSMGRIRANRGL